MTPHLFRVTHAIDELVGESPPTTDSLSHADMARNLISVCDLQGWLPRDAGAALGGHGHESAVGMVVSPPGCHTLPNGWVHTIALHYCLLRSGYWVTKAPYIYYGVTQPGKCGVALGAIRMKKRGSQFNRPPVIPQIVEALQQILKETSKYHERLYKLQGWKMSRSECDRLMVDVGRKKLIPRSRVFRVLDLSIGDGNEVSFWDLLTAFAEVVRINRPITKQMKQVLDFVLAVEKMGVGT